MQSDSPYLIWLLNRKSVAHKDGATCSPLHLCRFMPSALVRHDDTSVLHNAAAILCCLISSLKQTSFLTSWHRFLPLLVFIWPHSTRAICACFDGQNSKEAVCDWSESTCDSWRLTSSWGALHQMTWALLPLSLPPVTGSGAVCFISGTFRTCHASCLLCCFSKEWRRMRDWDKTGKIWGLCWSAASWSPDKTGAKPSVNTGYFVFLKSFIIFNCSAQKDIY